MSAVQSAGSSQRDCWRYGWSGKQTDCIRVEDLEAGVNEPLEEAIDDVWRGVERALGRRGGTRCRGKRRRAELGEFW